MLTNILSLVICLSTVVRVWSLCPNGYARHDDSCYKLIRTKATWAESTIYCRAMGAELANLETAVEDHFVHGWLENVGDGYDPKEFWIGGNDIVTEDEWMWATTHTRFKDTGYTNWAPNQPDNSGSNDPNDMENCVELTKKFSWNWNDDNCEDEKYFICEKPSTEVGGNEIIG